MNTILLKNIIYNIEMYCVTSCVIGMALLIGSVLTSMASKDDAVFKKYLATLDPSQVEAYERIVSERSNIYLQSTFVGLIAVFLYYLMIGNKKVSWFLNACTFVAIFFVVQYLYYILSPKSDWMLYHLRTKDQLKGWTAVYRHMSYRWHIGIAVGIAAVFLMGRGCGGCK